MRGVTLMTANAPGCELAKYRYLPAKGHCSITHLLIDMNLYSKLCIQAAISQSTLENLVEYNVE